MSNLATIVNNILADSGIDDINVVVTNGSYSNPAWITALSWSKITSTPTTLSGYGITDAVPANRTITINGTAQDLSANRSWSVGTVTSVDMSVPTGFAIGGNPITSSGTLALTFAAGYSLPTTAVQSNWTTAYNDSIVSAAVTGTTTKTLTLTQQDGGTITASWTDYDTAPVTSVNAGTGISVNSTTGAVTVTNTGVLSVNGSTGAVTGIITTSNYNSYSPTLTGGGASGTWGINITGDAGTLDGIDSTGFYRQWTPPGSAVAPATGLNAGSAGWTAFDGYGAAVPNYPAATNQWWVGLWQGGDASRGIQLAGGYADNELYYRKGAGTWQSWIRILNSSNYTEYAVQTTTQSNWNSYSVINNVVGLLAWKNYGSNHVIFDASQGTSPSGGGVSQVNATYPWAASYPTLMGWNGTDTYGVRVDSARISDNTSGNSATTSQTNFSALTINSAAVATQSWVNSQGFVTGGPYLPLSGGTVTGATIYTGNLYARKNQTSGDYTTAALWTESYGNTTTGIAFHISGVLGSFLEMRTNGILYWANNVVLHSGNYNSYAPTLTGTGASGTWGINITGNAGSANSTQTLAYTYLGSGSVNVNNSNGAIYRTDSGTGAVLAYAPVLHIGGGDTMWQAQGTYGTSGNGTFYFRQGYNGSWGNWLTMLSSANYNSYSPTLTGGGASGTWSINITGSAGSASSATSATYLNSSNYIDQTGSTGSWNADFQNTPAGTARYGGDVGANQTNGPGGSWWIQQNFRHTNGSNYWGTQVAWGWEDNANRLATRNVTGGTFGAWVYYMNNSNSPYAWNMNQYVRTSDNVEFNQVSIRGALYVSTWGNSSDIYMTDGDEGTRRIHCNSNRVGFLNQSDGWGAWCDDNGNWGMSLNAYMAGNRFDIQGAEGQISFKDSANVWTGTIGFSGNTGTISYPGRNIEITAGYNATITLNNGNTGYDSGKVYIPYGVVDSTKGYVSNGNPWNTSNSAYFPNGITTAGGTNWIYGSTYIGNAPSNGSGAEISNVGRIYVRNGNTSGDWGYAGLFLDNNNAANNYVPWSFEEQYGNHSWGIMARFHIRQAGADRPSIQFTAAGGNDRWSLGYCTSGDWNFRITQNQGYRTDNSTNDGWGTERFKIDTSGNTYAAIGGTLYANGTQVVTNSGTWGINISGNAATASDSSAVGGVDISRIVYGDNSTKTSNFGNPNDTRPSGFWNNYTSTNVPYESWWHMIVNRHSNPANNYQLQIIGEFWDNGMYFRKVRGNNTDVTNWARIVNSVQDPYAANMNQYVRTTDAPTFSSNLYISADGSSGYVASRMWLYSHNNYRGAGIYMSGTNKTWFAGTPYTDFEGLYIIARTDSAGDDACAQIGNRRWSVDGAGNTVQTGAVYATNLIDYNNNTYYLNLDGGGYLRGLVTVTGGHYNSAINVILRADENGAGSGQVTLRAWCSEPGVTWNWAGFGYNVTNDGGSPGGFSRINGNFGQAYMRFSEGGQLRFYNTNTSGTRVETAIFAENGSVTFNYSSTFNNNVKIYPVGESWGEGLAFIMPTTSTWGGLRWQRQRAGNDGNWYLGFTALDASDDLVFGANNGGTQVNNIIRMTKAGPVSFVSTVTASAFYESSDRRIKDLVDSNYKVQDIELVKPKLYRKNGVLEYGYYAQDFKDLLPSAIHVGDNGFLNLSYTQVHSAKIAYLEDSIEEIKAKILYLENQLKTKQ